MARILALDYGKRRTGVAVTDPLKIIANPLDTIPTKDLFPFLERYFKNEEVESIVVGMPRRLDNTDTHSTKDVMGLIERLKSIYPEKKVFEEDEKFTSKMAKEAMIAGGMKKKDRRNKMNVDRISATIILQSFLSHQL